ncbi:hypothetical protein CY658_17135 [Variovorax sp. RO1]|nr:hypothetical protein CY658_17135 [Variovorax sp. RO1]
MVSWGLCLLPEAGSSARRRTHFLLLRQKKVSKEKATPLSASLRFATGNLRCSRFAGSRRTRCAQTAASPDPRNAALLGAARGASIPDGPLLRSAWEQPMQIPTAAGAKRLRRLRGRAQRWHAGFPTPSVCAEERSVSRIRARPCLSEASLGETPRNVSTAGCPQRSGGTQTAGSPFFCLRFFGEAKKSRSPAGARPGLGKQTRPAT